MAFIDFIEAQRARTFFKAHPHYTPKLGQYDCVVHMAHQQRAATQQRRYGHTLLDFAGKKPSLSNSCTIRFWMA